MFWSPFGRPCRYVRSQMYRRKPMAVMGSVAMCPTAHQAVDRTV